MISESTKEWIRYMDLYLFAYLAIVANYSWFLHMNVSFSKIMTTVRIEPEQGAEVISNDGPLIECSIEMEPPN